MKLLSLTDLFIEGLQDLYDIEQLLLKALPKMSKTAIKEEIQEAFSIPTEQTESHLKRLDDMLSKLHSKPAGKSCDGNRGMITEAERLLGQVRKADPSVRRGTYRGRSTSRVL